MKRAVLYLRVSTIDQTTANQERELRISRPFDVAINESIRLAERARALRH
jgi:DNA invertase Pin-like site-specific DNA recombinase